MAGKRELKPAVYRPALAPFVRILLTLGSGATFWLILAFVFGVTALGVISNFVFTAAYDPDRLTLEAALRVFVAVVGLIGLAYVTYRLDLRQARLRSLSAVIDEKQIAPPHRGLIWLLSPGALDLPLFAITHHYTGKDGTRLRHCWVLITSGAQGTFKTLVERLGELGIDDVALHPVHLEAETIEACYDAVEAIYRRHAAQVEIRPDEIIADLTGGLKTMTAGMVLACLPYRRRLEYIQSDRDEAGRPITGSLRAILVGVNFRMTG